MDILNQPVLVLWMLPNAFVTLVWHGPFMLKVSFGIWVLSHWVTALVTL